MIEHGTHSSVNVDEAVLDYPIMLQGSRCGEFNKDVGNFVSGKKVWENSVLTRIVTAYVFNCEVFKTYFI